MQTDLKGAAGYATMALGAAQAFTPQLAANVFGPEADGDQRAGLRGRAGAERGCRLDRQRPAQHDR